MNPPTAYTPPADPAARIREAEKFGQAILPDVSRTSPKESDLLLQAAGFEVDDAPNHPSTIQRDPYPAQTPEFHFYMRCGNPGNVYDTTSALPEEKAQLNVVANKHRRLSVRIPYDASLSSWLLHLTPVVRVGAGDFHSPYLKAWQCGYAARPSSSGG